MFDGQRSRVSVVAVCLAAAAFVAAAQAQTPATEPNLTEEQKREFLLHGKVVNRKEIGKGVTHPWRLTLSDGTLTHDAAFQSIDERKNSVQFAGGPSEVGFRDSYHYNIAAYELARLLGLDDMVPVTVERKWKGESGALSWWVPWKWDEEMRRKLNLMPPNMKAWAEQTAKVDVFAKLIYDTDRNAGNVLITEDWKIWLIDFTRAFRLHTDLPKPEQLQRCERNLLEKLRQLNEKELLARTDPHLTKGEVAALLARRDRILERFQQRIAEWGENVVLY
ncbi:MAG: hypothetical protein ABSA70_13315 [Terriglobia bacterium]